MINIVKSIKKVDPISILICLYILISPFLVYYYAKSPFEFPKFIFSIVIAEVLAILLFLKHSHIKKNKLVVIASAFILVNFLADMLGLDPRVSLIGGEYRFQGLLLLITGFIFLISANIAKNRLVILRSVIFSSVLISFYAIYQFLLLKSGSFVPNYNGRVVATLGNPNFIGAYLVMALPFVLFTINNKLLKTALTILIIWGIFISYSLSAAIALLIILAVYFFTILKKKKLFVKLLFVSVLLILGTIILFRSNENIVRFSPWDNRLIIWEKGLASVYRRPLFGIGQENFETIIPPKMFYKVDNAHNIFLETAVSSGLLGLLLYLAIIKLPLKNASIELKSAIIGFIIVGFFNPLPIICLNLFWILIGLSEVKKN